MQSPLTFPSPKDHCPPTTKNRQLSENNAKTTMWLATAFQGVSAVVLCGVVAATWTCKYSSTEINIPPTSKSRNRTRVRCFASKGVVLCCTLPLLLGVCGVIQVTMVWRYCCEYKNHKTRCRRKRTVRDRQAAIHVPGGSQRNGSPYLGRRWCHYWEATAWSRLPWCDDDGNG